MTDLADLLTQAESKGTDQAYIAWTQLQPSCLGGDFDQWIDGEGRSVAAHTRRARDSGTAFKARYATIPLQNRQHLYQHQHGEAACLERYLGGKWSREDAAEWFDDQRIANLRRWVEGR